MTSNERAVAKTDEAIRLLNLEIAQLRLKRDELTHTSRENQARQRPLIEAKIATKNAERFALKERRKDQFDIVQGEAIAAQEAVVAAAVARRVKKDAELAKAVTHMQRVAAEQNAEARTEDDEKSKLAALERERAQSRTPKSPAELARATYRARLLELAQPVKLESDRAPTYSDPLTQPAPVLVNAPEQETVLERAERLAGRGSEALVLPDSVERINRVVPSAAQSQVVHT